MEVAVPNVTNKIRERVVVATSFAVEALHACVR